MNKKILLYYLIFCTTSTIYSTAYIANSGGNNVIPVNTTTNTAGTPIALIGFNTTGVAITPNKQFVYVTNQNGGDSTTGCVPVINTSNNTVFTTIQDPSFVNPQGIAIAPNNSIAYVVNSGSTTVSYFQTGIIAPAVNTFNVGNGPLNCAITPNGHYIYVTNAADGTVSAYDISGVSPVFFATIGSGTFSSPEFLAITPDGNTVYMTDASGKVFYFATGQTNPTINSITVGTAPDGIAITPNGLFAYVANFNSNNVSMISLPNTVVATIPVGINPSGVAITPDNATVYVNNFGSTPGTNNVSYFPVGNTSPTVNNISNASFNGPIGIAIVTVSNIVTSGGIWDILVQFANTLSISFSPTSGDRSLAATIAPHSPFTVTVSPSQGLWDIVFNMGTAVGSSPSPEQGVRELLVNMAPFV